MYTLTYSEIAYLNASKLGFDASFLSNKEDLPSGEKVGINKLGNYLVECAFANLHKEGLISLQLENKRVFGIFPTKAVSVKRTDKVPVNISGLEKAIYDLAGDTNSYLLVYKLIGGEMTVPWTVVTSFVKESLVQKQVLTKEEIVKKIIVKFVSYKYGLNETMLTQVDYNWDKVKMTMDEFKNYPFHLVLVKSINKAISAQVEKSDSDD